jgi:hypothetical protein
MFDRGMDTTAIDFFCRLSSHQIANAVSHSKSKGEQQVWWEAQDLLLGGLLGCLPFL